MWYNGVVSCIFLLFVSNVGAEQGKCLYSNTVEQTFSSFYEGCVSEGDHLLFHKVIHKHGLIFIRREAEFSYPLVQGAELETITSIRATDLIGKKKGGAVQIVAGGVGKKYVVAKIIGDKGSAINFDVRIYGK